MFTRKLPYAECDRLIYAGIFYARRFEHHDSAITGSHVLAVADASEFGMIFWIVTHVREAVRAYGISWEGSNRDPCDGVQIGLCCWSDWHDNFTTKSRLVYACSFLPSRSSRNSNLFCALFTLLHNDMNIPTSQARQISDKHHLLLNIYDCCIIF